ncbi:dienelactone hydrolase family protein [Bradyrhizobium sediminis]|uniref:Dienelactone hydrolase family protein n=1 Tax=Bradyrhizobium sediminis TaxID=2840469 RepID=A0A975P1G5_9BRAD|nr:dienelactone hydrolase family protein [Bradyrhizobium sediminis]QWG24860.1 dienelactone hydrolase family protein [Bradyrhizobium sediminis]
MIELTAGDGHKFSAYRADPDGTPKGAVVVVQDCFGITPQIRKVTDEFAAKGYLAIAPALFDSVKTDVALGHDEGGLAEGTNLMQQVGTDRAVGDIQEAVDAVKSAGKVTIVGYGWGGYLAYVSANRVSGVACTVGYYGGGIVDDYREKRKVPTLLHFGEADPLTPLEQVGQFRSHRPDVSAFSYPDAAHAFNCDDRDSYHGEAAKAALERTLVWISQYVEGQPPVALKNAGAYAQAKVEKKKKKKDTADDLGPPMD